MLKWKYPKLILVDHYYLIDTPTWKALSEDLQNREYHAHNRLIASVTMHPEERRQVARLIAKKLKMAKGKTAFFLPLQGIEEWDKEGDVAYDPEGLAAFTDEVRKTMKDPIGYTEIDAHINDQAFADAALDVFDGWLSDGTVTQ